MSKLKLQPRQKLGVQYISDCSDSDTSDATAIENQKDSTSVFQASFIEDNITKKVSHRPAPRLPVFFFLCVIVHVV